MTPTFDVAARSAEGAPAVEVLARYVAACRQLGYQHPDLTLHDGQVRDRYGSEDGMDLAALQQDCAALEAAVHAAQEALGVQQRQLEVLSAAWQGAGARASADVLRRHSDASAAVTVALRTARDALGELRESLWRSVDAKVDAAIEIEGRAAAVRGQWLAAAATVTGGVGDRAAASELVDHAVKPFVEHSVATDWLTAMRTATSSVAGAYERATAEIAGERLPVFEVTGAFDPMWNPPASSACDVRAWYPVASGGPAAVPAYAAVAPGPDPAAGPVGPAVATPPAAWAAPSPAVPAGSPGLPEPSAVPLVGTEPSMLPSPRDSSTMPTAGLGGAGPPALGGLAGLGQQFADAVSGLLGGVGDAVGGDVAEPDAPDLEDPFSFDDGEDGQAGDDPDDDDDGDEDPDEEPDGDEEPEDADGEPADGNSEPGPAEDVDPAETVTEQPGSDAAVVGPPPAPPPAEPLPPVESMPDESAAGGRTPCEIAADELPQVGEPAVSSPGTPAGR